ncbi:MAG: FAD-dependent oxidoreductase [Coriobacteriales bacterium]|nr:FAD-dependent oxidoreductase [Coriobacteriales bacterium]
MKLSAIDRRQLLQAAGIGAAAAAVGSIPFAAAESLTNDGDWLGEAPVITDADCAEVRTADVVVIGAGVAGIAAARSAVESGASVLVVEQAEKPTIRGLVFGAINSEYQKSLGCVVEDPTEVVNEMCREMGNRPNMRLWMKWAKESGPAFDWFEAALDGEFEYFLEMWPQPEMYDNEKEFRKQWNTGIEFVDWVGANTKQYEKSVEEGVVYAFNMHAELLAKDEAGVVTGVYATAEDGSIVKFEGTKGVILTTGDYGHNLDMVKALCPEFLLATNGNGISIATSNGDGHKMAIWAGGWMEPAPHAHMDHTFQGMGGVGNVASLCINTKGDRFANEDVDGQSFTNQILRQPQRKAFTIFDGNWPEMIKNQGISHGKPNPVTMDVAAMQERLAGSVGTSSPFMSGAETLEELFEMIGVPVEQGMATVARYNELCAKGHDDDFGKRPDRMYPIDTPPFFATGSLIAVGLMTAGIMVNENLQVIDENFDPIPHLWAAGNVAGGRYYNEYPVYPCVATSHGTAITFGRSCGLQAAANEA